MATSVKIERGVPLPSRRYGALSHLPFEQMRAGESIAVPIPDGSSAEMWQRRVLQFIRRQEFTDRKFTTSQEARKIRVWRVK